MVERTQRLREFLTRTTQDLFTVKDLAKGTGLAAYEITSLLRFVRPAWENSEYHDRAELLKALGPEDTVADDDDFAEELPVPTLGTKLVLEGRNVLD